MGSGSYLQKRETERERVIDNEMSKSLINSLKPYLCGYRKTLKFNKQLCVSWWNGNLRLINSSIEEQYPLIMTLHLQNFMPIILRNRCS